MLYLRSEWLPEDPLADTMVLISATLLFPLVVCSDQLWLFGVLETAGSI